MKIVINRCYGGFAIPEQYLEQLNLRSEYSHIERTDPRLISLIEEHGGTLEKIKHGPARLTIVEIPDEATDYEICDYDGFETIICVLDGKLHHIPEG